VERGDVTGAGLRPDVLVSLSAPKLCAARFEGAHFLGGRFVPKYAYALAFPPHSARRR
jgi:NAD(P)H-hydrate epimerase